MTRDTMGFPCCFRWGVTLLCSIALLVRWAGASSAAVPVLAARPECHVQYPEDLSYLSNGDCDREFNNELCGFDGGDCCSCTCQQGLEHTCGESGYDCVDPSATCFVAVATAERNLQEDEVSPTSSPTAAPTSSWQASAEAVAAAASNLSSDVLGAIIAAGLVVVLIAGGFYLYRKRRRRRVPGSTFAATESGRFA